MTEKPLSQEDDSDDSYARAIVVDPNARPCPKCLRKGEEEDAWAAEWREQVYATERKAGVR